MGLTISHDDLVYRSIVDALINSQAIGLSIVCNGVYVYVNNSLTAMFHYADASEIIGMNCENLYEYESRTHIKSIQEYQFSNSSTPLHSRVVGLRKDGSTFDVLILAHQIEYNIKPATLNFAIDMSFQKNLLDRSLRLEKIEAIAMLARGIAHEINNIIGVLSGNIEMISLSAPNLSRDSIYLEQVVAACKRGKELSQQLFRLAPKQIEDATSVSMAPIVSEALAILKPSIPEFIRILQKNEIPPGEDLIHANPTQVMETLVDLCKNAVHAMREEGGVIEIAMGNLVLVSESTEYPDFYLPPGRYLRLAIKDVGHGIDPSLTERIFDPFFTTKGPGEGAGLGLAVASATMRNLGGAIAVESVPGKGSTFNLLFPRIEIDPSEISKDSDQLPTILLIQDDAELADWGAALLDGLGYIVVRKSSVIDALDLLSDGTASLHVVIVDSSLLQVGAVRFMEGLVALRPDIPTILWGGKDEAFFEESNAVQLLKKPATARDLASAVRRALNVRLKN